MGFIEDDDVRTLLQDPELMSDIAKAVVEDPEAMDDLANNIVDKLSDQLEDDSALLKGIITAAIANPEIKRRIVKKLVADLS